jgi:tRNA(adenine34) deaminase
VTGSDERYMRLALEQAERALAHEDVPIGAVLVKEGQVLAAAPNRREAEQDPTAHAEMIVLREGAKALASRRLEGTELYVTLEPCPMCAGAMVLARIARVIYGPQDPRAGAAYSLYNIVQDPRLNHEVAITTGVLEAECAALLQAFFKKRRGAEPP